MIRRILLVSCLLSTGVVVAGAQAPQGPENVGPDLLPAARIDSLPRVKRAEWRAYIARSVRLHAADTAAMTKELRSAKRPEMAKAPYRAPDFRWFERDDAWLRSDSATRIAESVLTFQTLSGGWSKRTDMMQPRTPGMSYYSETPDWHYIPTFDNGATTGQLRFLARMHAVRADPRYAAAYHRGLSLLFAAQQPNGCWPQTYPLEGGYHDAITFNDDATVLALTTLDEAAASRTSIATTEERHHAANAARSGVDCLIATQVRVLGQPTVWGQQHDPLSLAIVPARRYELAGLAGRESASILAYLMTLPNPDAKVVTSVHAAATWFRTHAIRGFRYDSNGLRADSTAPPIWARLTEVATDRPIFANRDAVKLYDWNQLTDRRTGYAWFSAEPAQVLKSYDVWSREHPLRAR